LRKKGLPKEVDGMILKKTYQSKKISTIPTLPTGWDFVVYAKNIWIIKKTEY